jgi:hypothetical protein
VFRVQRSSILSVPFMSFICFIFVSTVFVPALTGNAVGQTNGTLETTRYRSKRKTQRCFQSILHTTQITNKFSKIIYLLFLNIRGKAVPINITKPHRGKPVEIHSFFTSALRKGKWWVSRSDRFTAEKEPPVPFEWKTAWVPEPAWTCWRREISVNFAGNRTACRLICSLVPCRLHYAGFYS